MIACKTKAEAWQIHWLHPRLWEIVCWLEEELWHKITAQHVMVLTEIFRTREETTALYAGRIPPASSVHECKPERGAVLSGTRGVDISDRRVVAGLPYWEWPKMTAGIMELVEHEINRTWQYRESNAHQVAVYHDVKGTHLHLQCRPEDETVRRG